MEQDPDHRSSDEDAITNSISTASDESHQYQVPTQNDSLNDGDGSLRPPAARATQRNESLLAREGIALAHSMERVTLDARGGGGTEGGDFVARMHDHVCRVRTFSKQPANMKQSPESLSVAGFYYAGSKDKPDRVRCYSCGRDLFHWDPVDDPAVQHAVFSPSCRHIRYVMGDDFVDDVQKMWTRQSFMDTPAAQAVREMGYSDEDIHTALIFHEKNEGEATSTVSARKLLSAIMELEKLGWLNKENRWNVLRPLADVAADLEEQNHRMEAKFCCKVCLDKKVEVLFMPCRHLVCCGDCAAMLNHCPICRQLIKKKKQVLIP